MLLPLAVFKTSCPSTVGTQPLLRIGVPEGKSFHLKYVRIGWYSAPLFVTRIYINGILNSIWDQFTYCGDIPFNVILPEFTQIRIDIEGTTQASTVINAIIVGDLY